MNVYERSCFHSFLDHFKKIDEITIVSMNDTDFILQIGKVTFFLYINPKNCIVYSAVTTPSGSIHKTRNMAVFLFEGKEPSEVTTHMMKKGAMTR